ncbi:hypothetical protein [Mycobacterium lepromatosis]|uniref:hypothetical protein n=1 Tax=Mycobacterium lepromatosis TaxID=480418 RepID=UPI0012DFED6A|nr:hypothetical protein [Mycobacterium lepromatosis]
MTVCDPMLKRRQTCGGLSFSDTLFMALITGMENANENINPATWQRKLESVEEVF